MKTNSDKISFHNSENENDCMQSRTFNSFKEAEEFYLMALHRLLNISQWNALTGRDAGEYRLLNREGQLKTDAVEEGDFIEIRNLDSQNAGTIHLLVARKIAKQHNHIRSMVLITRRVNLRKAEFNLSYSVEENITYTFFIQLSEQVVLAGVYEKNKDLPTDEESGLYDKITAMFTNVFAAGKSNQWSELVSGILK